ncbi:hypothetical protein [Labrenzia sp. CE80]|uniref:hypothetical protein n=1 Tax=Labrenzia sp. CE80 TaxID=1788986 RepID=UPI00129B95E3|nr:hypothetical protein [Labrenzia sp. CE80]
MSRGKGAKDLVEYFRNWNFERQKIIGLVESGRLSEDEKTSLLDMVFVIDRIGPADLEPLDPDAIKQTKI